MRFTDFSYYNRLLDVPNINETCTNDYSLDIFIGRYEKEAVRLMLGECLSRDLYSNLQTDTNGLWQLVPGADIKWANLLNGLEYDSLINPCFSSSDCNKYVWRGLRYISNVWDTQTNTQQTIKQSPIALYVYYNWLMDNRSQTVINGENVVKPKIGVSIDNKAIRVDVWNEFVSWVVVSNGGDLSLQDFIKHQNKIAKENNLPEPYVDFCNPIKLEPITYWES